MDSWPVAQLLGAAPAAEVFRGGLSKKRFKISKRMRRFAKLGEAFQQQCHKSGAHIKKMLRWQWACVEEVLLRGGVKGWIQTYVAASKGWQGGWPDGCSGEF